MEENETKGWYGSYSIVGRPLAERIHYLLNKDDIISGRLAHKKNNNDQNKSGSSMKNKDNNIDIFAENINEKTSTKNTKDKNMSIDISVCHDTNTTIDNNYLKEKQNYSFHINKHKELSKRKNDKIKARKSIDYNPKMDIIWKKAISGPQWDTIKGRENNISKTTDFKFYFTNSHFLPKHKAEFIMKKQTQRGLLPIYSDSRIRTDKAFNSKHKHKKNYFLVDNDNKRKVKINFRNKRLFNNLKGLNFSESNENSSFSKTHFILDKQKNNTKNSNKNTLNINKNQFKIITNNKTNKKRNNFNLNKNKKLFKGNHSIDFSKYISREKLNRISLSKKSIQRYFFSPRYSLVKPRSVSMVSYDKDKISNTPPKRFEGVESHLFFDPNKIINKVNNHTEPNAPNFGIMSGRVSNSDLPFHMLNANNRTSLDIMTGKSLRMNSYSNEVCENTNSESFNNRLYKSIINNILDNKDGIKARFKLFNNTNGWDKNSSKLFLKKKYEDSPCTVGNQLENQNKLKSSLKKSLKTIKRNKLLDFYF